MTTVAAASPFARELRRWRRLRGQSQLDLALLADTTQRNGELRLITTLTSFATATDITLAELHLEAFLPADEVTATYLRERAHAVSQRR